MLSNLPLRYQQLYLHSLIAINYYDSFLLFYCQMYKLQCSEGKLSIAETGKKDNFKLPKFAATI